MVLPPIPLTAGGSAQIWEAYDGYHPFTKAVARFQSALFKYAEVTVYVGAEDQASSNVKATAWARLVLASLQTVLDDKVPYHQSFTLTRRRQ